MKDLIIQHFPLFRVYIYLYLYLSTNFFFYLPLFSTLFFLLITFSWISILCLSPKFDKNTLRSQSEWFNYLWLFSPIPPSVCRSVRMSACLSVCVISVCLSVSVTSITFFSFLTFSQLSFHFPKLLLHCPFHSPFLLFPISLSFTPPIPSLFWSLCLFSHYRHLTNLSSSFPPLLSPSCHSARLTHKDKSTFLGPNC